MDQKHVTKILSFYSMGDGSLTIHKGCRNASFHITLKACHRDLLEDLATLIEDGVGTVPHLTDARPDGHPEHGKYLRLGTRVHPKFTRLYSRIYVGSYRGLDPHAFKMFDWESLAILFMCDGSTAKRTHAYGYDVTLNLCRLSYGDHLYLKHKLFEVFGLEWTVCKCGYFKDGTRRYRLCLRTRSQQSFFEGIRPYLYESFMYKCPNVDPQQAVG